MNHISAQPPLPLLCSYDSSSKSEPPSLHSFCLYKIRKILNEEKCQNRCCGSGTRFKPSFANVGKGKKIFRLIEIDMKKWKSEMSIFDHDLLSKSKILISDFPFFISISMSRNIFFPPGTYANDGLKRVPLPQHRFWHFSSFRIFRIL